MANGFESIRIKRLIDMYRGNPMLFTDDQLDELEELAKQIDEASTPFEMEKLQARLANFSGGGDIVTA